MTQIIWMNADKNQKFFFQNSDSQSNPPFHRTKLLNYFLILFLISSTMLISCYSPKKLYKKEVEQYKESSICTKSIFTIDGIAHLPTPVQRYFNHCGFLGIQMPDFAEIHWAESHIKLRPNQKWLRLKTLQHNFITEPSRVVYMRANMMGVVPFEGRDKYHDGHGHMFGILGRMIKIFDAKEYEIAQGAAIVVLAECLLVPSFAIQPYIHWEAVDDRTAKARFIHKGVDVGGTFHFNEQGEYIRFTSNERPFSLPKGGYKIIPYTIEIRSYQQQGDIRIAKEVAAIWNLPEGDFEYFKGKVARIEYNK
jgi:hypothetical protein